MTQARISRHFVFIHYHLKCGETIHISFANELSLKVELIAKDSFFIL